MECQKDENLLQCSCTYEPCARKGFCCECLHYHRQQDELPACYFSPGIEKTYNRSIRQFIAKDPKAKR